MRSRYLKKFRFKESLVPGISKSSKNCWVSWKNWQRPSGFFPTKPHEPSCSQQCDAWGNLLNNLVYTRMC
jgi:hypothetical protein